MSKPVDIELKSNKVITGTILAKALNVLIVHSNEGEFLLVSKSSIKDPSKFKFKE